MTSEVEDREYDIEETGIVLFEDIEWGAWNPIGSIVDVSFLASPHAVEIEAHDAGFWLALLPHRSAALQVRLGVDRIYVDGVPVVCSHLEDVLSRIEPELAEGEGHYVTGVDPVDDEEIIDVPLEERTFFDDFGMIKKIEMGEWRGIPSIKNVYFTTDYEEAKNAERVPEME